MVGFEQEERVSMPRPIVGTRIRQQRHQLGITQTDLARRAGISPSYLNLIEWNKRSVPSRLMQRISEALGVSVEALDGATERRLHAELLEIAHLPALRSTGVETNRTDELIGRFPGWSRGIAALAKAEQESLRSAQILSERLSNDPYLSEAVHRMRSRIAAVRSAANILVEYNDLTNEQTTRFTSIVAEESTALSQAGEALANYLDKAEGADRILTPVDEVEALCEQRNNRFEELERAAEALEIDFVDDRPASRFERARACVSEYLEHTIDALLEAEEIIQSAAAHKRARELLFDYAISAVLMPDELFCAQAKDAGYDVEALAQIFSVGVDRVCHRLTALPLSEELPKIGYVQANAAGTVVQMHNLEGLQLPRYAAACPLWALYRAQQSPEAVIRQRALFPEGARFVFLARARHVGVSGFGRPRHYVTDMIILTERDARRTVYAPDASVPLEEVGPSCRLCPRVSCIHRVEDPLS